MPYTWTCTSCGLQLYSAALEAPHEDCPRCGSAIPREPDNPPPPQEANAVKRRRLRLRPFARRGP
jgi:hypothetical protein